MVARVIRCSRRQGRSTEQLPPAGRYREEKMLATVMVRAPVGGFLIVSRAQTARRICPGSPASRRLSSSRGSAVGRRCWLRDAHGYGHPPDAAREAIDLVIAQTETFAEDWAAGTGQVG